MTCFKHVDEDGTITMECTLDMKFEPANSEQAESRFTRMAKSIDQMSFRWFGGYVFDFQYLKAKETWSLMVFHNGEYLETIRGINNVVQYRSQFVDGYDLTILSGYGPF